MWNSLTAHDQVTTGPRISIWLFLMMGKCFTRKRKPTTRTYIFNCLFFFFFYFVYNVYINRIHYSQKSLRYWASWCSLLIDKWSRAGRFTDKTAVWNFAFQFLLTSCAKKKKNTETFDSWTFKSVENVLISSPSEEILCSSKNLTD